MKESMVFRLSDFVICDMDLVHLKDVVEIENLSFKTPWSSDAFYSELTRNKCAKYRVILKDGKVVAYGGMWLMLDEAHITNIAVHPEFRGTGIGNEMMADIIAVAEKSGMNSMTLEVRFSNTPAINLYKKYGFVEVAIRKGYYQDTKEDAIIMWKHDLKNL